MSNETPSLQDYDQRLLYKLVKNLSAPGAASDSVLAAVEGMTDVQKQQLADALAVTTVMEYKGTWNASTNTPALASGVGSKGDVWFVGTAGTTNLNGNNTWEIGDLAIFSGTVWQSVSGADIAAVLYTAQTLSAPQQLQARTNVGLSNVDNTSDANKPISTATATALATKMDKVANNTGKVLINSFGNASNSNASIAATTIAGTLELVRGNDLRLQQATTTQNGTLKTAVYADILTGAEDLAVTPASLFDGFGDPGWLNGKALSSMTIRNLTTDLIDLNLAAPGTNIIVYDPDITGLTIYAAAPTGETLNINAYQGMTLVAAAGEFSLAVGAPGLSFSNVYGGGGSIINTGDGLQYQANGAGHWFYNNIGFFGAVPAPQQFYSFAPSPTVPTLTGVYLTDYNAIGDFLAAVRIELMDIRNGLGAYGLLLY